MQSVFTFRYISNFGPAEFKVTALTEAAAFQQADKTYKWLTKKKPLGWIDVAGKQRTYIAFVELENTVDK